MSAQDAFQLSFDFLPHLPVVVQSDSEPISSDAGLIPIRQFDERWRFTQKMAACLSETRSVPSHSLLSMLRQRVFGIIAGYEDCNDHDRLRDDSVFKLIARERFADEALAAQPSLSRFENAIDIPSLQRLIDFNIATGISVLKHRHGGELPASLTLDIDATDDTTHGQQQLSMFHGYYDQHQYFPIVISEPTSRHVFLAWLRPGAVAASLGADDDLKRVVASLRAARADLHIHVRGDCGFGNPTMYHCCELLNVSYTFGIAANERLKVIAQPLLDRAKAQYQQTGVKQRLFMKIEGYRADSWDRPRMIIAKAEYHARGENLRFVVTSLPCADAGEAQKIYDDYVQRGESEQRIDEMKNGLKLDRLSCHRFMANFARLLFHVAAYNLLNAIRADPKVPEELHVAQPQAWRDKLIKVAARVVISTRRVMVYLSDSWPFKDYYKAISQLTPLPA